MSDGKLFVDEFHKAGILVHPYAAKDDFLRYSAVSPIDEYDFYFNVAKVDGIFTENPYTAILSRDYFAHAKQRFSRESGIEFIYDL